jgi:hypothetical protein
MKITKEQFKKIVKEVMTEENEYQAFFAKALEKTGKSIPEMSEDEKKAFFDKIDSAWQGKGEKNEELVGGQKNLDIDGDGEIEASDLAALRAGKKVDEADGLWANIRAKQARGEKPAHGNSDAHKDAVAAGKKINNEESVNEEEVKWNAVENAIINFLKMNTKILDKRVKDRDTNGVKGGLQSIIDGLTNAQRSLKLK